GGRGAGGVEGAGRGWERGRVGGRPVHSLAPPDLLVQVVLHLAVQHAFERLLWFCDVALIAAALSDRDWQESIRGAQRLGYGAALGVTLDLLEDLFGIPVPAAARGRPGRP